MVDAFKTGRGIYVTLPPPAPVPRFSILPPPPSYPLLDSFDDDGPTRPWEPDAPTAPRTAPRTPPISWAAPAIPWLDETATRARNAPTVRPPAGPPSRLPAALHGFAAGLLCGAIGLVVIRGVEWSQEPAQASAQGAGTPAVATAPPPARPRENGATAKTSATPAAWSSAPVVRAEDLPHVTTRVEDLPPVPPAPPVQRRGVWRGRSHP